MGYFYFEPLSKLFILTPLFPKVSALSLFLIKEYTDEDFCKVV